MGGGGGEGGSGLDIGPGGKTITVTDFEVQPNSILSGSSTQVRLGIVNTGGMASNVTIANDTTDIEGKRILINHCPDIFSITDFDSYSSRRSSVHDTYNLKPGDELQLTWSLKNDNSDIPLNGYRCPLRLQVPFDYGVTAYQQLEVKSNQEVQGATVLESKTSQGPLNLHLEMIGSTSESGAPKFIKGDNMEVLVQLENTAPEESSYQGLVELDSPKIISSDRYLLNATSCNMETNRGNELVRSLQIDRPIRLYQGQSRVIRCNVRLATDAGSMNAIGEGDELDTPSVRGQIEAIANYTYIKDLGQKEVEVEYRG